MTEEICLSQAMILARYLDSILFKLNQLHLDYLFIRAHIWIFMKLPGTPTQEENIYIAMGKLSICPGDLFLDIGCGSGAVSLAASHFTDKIYGIDTRPEAIMMSQATVPGGIFLEGEASQLLPRLPKIDKCFIGGTLHFNEFYPVLLEKAASGCLIVAALARIGMACQVIDLMQETGTFRELLQINISRSYRLAHDLALKPVNPIFMVVGQC